MTRFIRRKTFILYSIAIILTAGGIYAWVSQGRETQEKVQVANASVEDLKSAVDDLKQDNGQQTIILCTLILGQNVSITGDDAAKIEAICKEKIKQTGVDIEPANPVVAPPSQVPVLPDSSSSPQNTTTTPPSQPNTSQQQTSTSILPFIDKPLVGCVNGVCI